MKEMLQKETIVIKPPGERESDYDRRTINITTQGILRRIH